MAAAEQVIQLVTVQAVQTLAINPYPESQEVAVTKSEAQVAIPAAVPVQAVHPVSAAFGPFPSSQVVQTVPSQIKQPSRQSVQTLSAKY